MEAQLQELFQFLHDKNPNVRQIALENLLGQTPAGSPHRNIFFEGLKKSGGSGISSAISKEADISRDLKLLCRDQLAVAHDAFRALVNLTDSPLWISALSEESFLVFLVSYILHPPSILADLAAMLLSNLTSQRSVCSTLLSLKIPIIVDQSLSYGYYPTQSRSGTSQTPSLLTSKTKEVVALPFLLDAFSTSAKVEGDESTIASSPTRKGELHFLSSVFANISLIPNGRLFFLTPLSVDLLESSSRAEYPIAKLISFTEHKDAIRRGGVAAVIKNCCFHGPAHKALLSFEDTEISVPQTQAEETLRVTTSESTVVNATVEDSRVAVEHSAALVTESTARQSSESNDSVDVTSESSETLVARGTEATILTTFTSNRNVGSLELGTIEQHSDSQSVERLDETSQAVVTPENEAPVPETPATSTVKAPGVNILPAILLPLTGPEELDLEDQEKLPAVLQFMPSTKKREPDSLLRLTHIESLLLLCTTRWGREFLRSNGTYEIVRVMHATEPVEKISDHVERLVNFLKRDESEETSKDEEIGEDQEEDSEDERIAEV